MSVEFHRGSPGKFDPRTLNRETLSRWTGCTPSNDTMCYVYEHIHSMYIVIVFSFADWAYVYL